MRALVVDDDRSWQAVIREILEDVGFVVDSAVTLPEALRLAQGTHRVAVIDLSLNERDHHNQDGLSVLKALHASDPPCASILLTGYATVELAVNAIKQFGAYDVLRKEAFNRNELKRLLGQILSVERDEVATVAQGEETTLARAESVPAKEHRTHILIVEDDTNWQDILTELLKDHGFTVRACGGFGEALGCLRREHYQLAIIDLSLNRLAATHWARGKPESLEGFRLLAGIQGSGTPVIILSGMTDPGLIEQTFEQRNVFAYIEKQSFNRRAFVQTVQDALERSVSNPELDRLTDREQGVLRLLAQGKTNKEIAEALVITTNTVKRHLKSIFAKLNIHTRAAAVAKARGDHPI